MVGKIRCTLKLVSLFERFKKMFIFFLTESLAHVDSFYDMFEVWLLCESVERP